MMGAHGFGDRNPLAKDRFKRSEEFSGEGAAQGCRRRGMIHKGLLMTGLASVASDSFYAEHRALRRTAAPRRLAEPIMAAIPGCGIGQAATRMHPTLKGRRISWVTV